eukprot:TRINITY_DN895_c0_g1_i5.p1 TRINITY_DN895_c0_g1~~TRINITY_DN895_c0_g1_i5.p1  ORF type:complete len:107 (+),score=35.98 TRINITY_DN895_c0_g1_i5:60-380(+)
MSVSSLPSSYPSTPKSPTHSTSSNTTPSLPSSPLIYRKTSDMRSEENSEEKAVGDGSPQDIVVLCESPSVSDKKVKKHKSIGKKSSSKNLSGSSRKKKKQTGSENN